MPVGGTKKCRFNGSSSTPNWKSRAACARPGDRSDSRPKRHVGRPPDGSVHGVPVQPIQRIGAWTGGDFRIASRIGRPGCPASRVRVQRSADHMWIGPLDTGSIVGQFERRLPRERAIPPGLPERPGRGGEQAHDPGLSTTTRECSHPVCDPRSRCGLRRTGGSGDGRRHLGGATDSAGVAEPVAERAGGLAQRVDVGAVVWGPLDGQRAVAPHVDREG